MIKNYSFTIVTLFVFLGISIRSNASQQNKNLPGELDSLYVWDIDMEPDGALMFLDVAYKTGDSCETEFLTLCVAKHKQQNRPAWISIILPQTVNPIEGVFLFFRSPVKSTIRLVLEKSNDTFVARLWDGYALDDFDKIDVFQKFLDANMVYFMFFLPDGGHKTIAVPLNSFHKQYRKLA